MKYISKSYFPGGNTTEGFFSYYDQIIPLDKAKKIYCIKGGPGAGKSTFMKKIGEHFSNIDYEVDYFWCSSDNNSLDGVLIKELGALFVDATAPHVIDPKYPGAVDVILNFGDFFDLEKLREYRQGIIESSNIVSENFSKAYYLLKSIVPIMDSTNQLFMDALDKIKLDSFIRSLKNEIFYDKKGSGFSERKLFLSAITPNGTVNHLEETIKEKTVYKIDGLPCDLSYIVINELYNECKKLGFEVETFYCPTRPKTKIDHIIIPQLNTAIVTSNHYHSYDKECITIDMAKYYFEDLIDSERLNFNLKQIDTLLNKAIEYIKTAKRNHDVLETYYIHSVDFKAIDRVREKITQELL